MSARHPGPPAVDLRRRLRAWSVSAWRHSDRIDQARITFERLSAAATVQDGLRRPPVPDAGIHALADQLDVLVLDAQACGVSEDDLNGILADLAFALGLPRL